MSVVKQSDVNINDTNPSLLAEQLKHVTEEMYKKNLEIVERNKTLAILRKIDGIILSAVTETQEIAQQVSNLVIKEGGLRGMFIYLIDKQEEVLNSLVVALGKSETELDYNLQRALGEMKVSLGEIDNHMVRAVTEKKMYQTNDLYDLFSSHLTKEACQEIQKTYTMNTFFIHPLIMRDEVLGLMIISVGNEGDEIFPYQKDLVDRLPEVVAIALDNALLYKRLEDANIRLKELDKLKDEFVSIASHELRTPMTAIKSYLWMALNKEGQTLEPQLKNYLEIAYTSSDRLIKLVQDMLTISRMEGNRYELKQEQIDMLDLTKQIYDELKVTANERKINFTLQSLKESAVIYGDREKIREVIQNIVGNALKYTPDNGSITISFEKQNGMVEILVQDTGPGITKEDIPKLFQKFNRINVDYVKEHNITSTGLGLYITSQIVSLHHGNIDVESEVGKGSTFVISIPEYKTGNSI